VAEGILAEQPGNGSEKNFPSFENRTPYILADRVVFRDLLRGLILLSVVVRHRYRLYHLTTQFNLRLEERVGERAGTRILRGEFDRYATAKFFMGLLALRFSDGMLNCSPEGVPAEKRNKKNTR